MQLGSKGRWCFSTPQANTRRLLSLRFGSKLPEATEDVRR